MKLYTGLITIVVLGSVGCSLLNPPPTYQLTLTPDMVLIPEGSFLMGSTERDGRVGIEVGVDEIPQHRIYLPAFYIDRYEVTNRSYKAFVDETGRSNKVPGYWQNGTYLPGSGKEPVSDTDWFDAADYCGWAGKRLPTEAEWEKAARGSDGRVWPWGDRFETGRSNTAEERHGWKRPVGSYGMDVSPYGVYDMEGNVKEWTSSWYEAYSGNTLKRVAFGKSFRVLKGGSYVESGAMVRLASRTAIMATHDPEGNLTWHTDYSHGFRCAKNARG